MTRHSRHASSGSRNASYMPVAMPDTTLYPQNPTRLTIPTQYFDTNTSPTGPLMPMAPLHPHHDTYDLYDSAALSQNMPPQRTLPAVHRSSYQSHRASSGAWTREDDDMLIEARKKGLNWNQVKDKFTNKTANACRKRHERLMERRDVDDWDALKMEKLAKEYMAMRKEIWSALASRVGEKWNVVEQKCLSSGLKNLQSASRSGSRRERQEGYAHASGYDDDSGISGIGLTPVDELDQAGHYISPDASPGASHHSSGSAHAAVSFAHSYAGHASHAPHSPYMHQQQVYVNGYGQGPTHGYSSSVSSSGSNGYGPPRMRSEDMDIGALVHPVGVRHMR